jgi:hypothetical protein
LFLIDLTSLGHYRIQNFSHHRLRNCRQLKVGVNGDFPKLIKTFRAGPLQSVCLDQQVDNIGRFYDARFGALASFIVVVKFLVFRFGGAGVGNNICKSSAFRQLPGIGAKAMSCGPGHVTNARLSPVVH